uniref:Dlx homeobox protein n=1 Tax=Isodiametra pulchra TaxID=504439 RepID=A0A2P1DV69_ISOPU|nr:Dlx homeobox protein [Isodiametra pulchra]
MSSKCSSLHTICLSGKSLHRMFVRCLKAAAAAERSSCDYTTANRIAGTYLGRYLAAINSPDNPVTDQPGPSLRQLTLSGPLIASVKSNQDINLTPFQINIETVHPYRINMNFAHQQEHPLNGFLQWNPEFFAQMQTSAGQTCLGENFVQPTAAATASVMDLSSNGLVIQTHDDLQSFKEMPKIKYPNLTSTEHHQLNNVQNGAIQSNDEALEQFYAGSNGCQLISGGSDQMTMQNPLSGYFPHHPSYQQWYQEMSAAAEQQHQMAALQAMYFPQFTQSAPISNDDIVGPLQRSGFIGSCNPWNQSRLKFVQAPSPPVHRLAPTPGDGEDSDKENIDPRGGSSPPIIRPFSSSPGHLASDAEQTGRSKRQGRTVFTKQQLEILNGHFNHRQYLSLAERAQLSEQLCLSQKQVKIWFQNMRSKAKRVMNASSRTQPQDLAQKQSQEAFECAGNQVTSALDENHNVSRNESTGESSYFYQPPTINSFLCPNPDSPECNGANGCHRTTDSDSPSNLVIDC